MYRANWQWSNNLIASSESWQTELMQTLILKKMLSSKQEHLYTTITKHKRHNAKSTKDPEVIYSRNAHGLPRKLQLVTDIQIDSSKSSKRTLRNRAASLGEKKSTKICTPKGSRWKHWKAACWTNEPVTEKVMWQPWKSQVCCPCHISPVRNNKRVVASLTTHLVLRRDQGDDVTLCGFAQPLWPLALYN